MRNCREIDREVVDDLLHTEEVGNKHFEGFLHNKLVVKDKKYHSMNLSGKQC